MKRLIALSFTFVAMAAAQCPVGYSYYRQLTVNTGQVVSGPLANFPMLVLNPSASLATVGNGGHVQNSNGYDITFYAGGSPLNFELVGQGTSNTTYNAANGNAEFWVNVASLNNGSSFYMCYGNAAANTYQGNDSGTWNSNVKYVIHAPGGTTLSVADSKGTAVSLGSTAPTATSGKIGGGMATAGSANSYVQVAGMGRQVKGYTLCTWLNFNAHTSSYADYIMGDYDSGGSHNSIGLNRDNVSGKLSSVVSDSYINTIGTTVINPGTWYFGCVVTNSTQLKVYTNGVQEGTPGNLTGISMSSAGSTYAAFGRTGAFSTSQLWNGKTDEIQFYNVDVGDAWVATLYRTQSAPGAFYTVGGENGSTAAIGVSPTAIPNNHSGNITLTLTGAGTSWNNASTVFTIAGVSGVSKISQNVTGATAATLVVTTGAATGTLVIAETITGSASTAATVMAPLLTLNVTKGNLNSVQALTLTGTNTVWSQEAAAGLFTLSGGSGASTGTPTITSDAAGSVLLTVGTSVGTLTITDTSTGKTATFSAGGAAGPSGCAVVFAQ